MKKYVIVGCGARGILSYAVPMVKEFSDCAELAGVFDPNHGRMALVSKLCGKPIPAFEDFDTMLDTVRPDAVIHCAAWTAVDAAEEPENYEKVIEIVKKGKIE